MTNHQTPMTNEPRPKSKFDLEARTLIFAQKTRDFLRRHKKDFADMEYARQLIRSSASVGANHIEADEALSSKDFFMRIKICRKESKESIRWMQLIETSNENESSEKNWLLGEARELLLIFNAIIKKADNHT